MPGILATRDGIRELIHVFPSLRIPLFIKLIIILNTIIQHFVAHSLQSGHVDFTSIHFIGNTFNREVAYQGLPIHLSMEQRIGLMKTYRNIGVPVLITPQEGQVRYYPGVSYYVSGGSRHLQALEISQQDDEDISTLLCVRRPQTLSSKLAILWSLPTAAVHLIPEGLAEYLRSYNMEIMFS